MPFVQRKWREFITLLDAAAWAPSANVRRGLGHVGALIAIGVIYFALAKAGLALASIHPSATPIWPPTGFALAAVLLWGYWTWPAIFAAALIANVTTAGSMATAIAIATGNSLEAIVGAYFIHRWSNGCNTYDALCCAKTRIPFTAAEGAGDHCEIMNRSLPTAARWSGWTRR